MNKLVHLTTQDLPQISSFNFTKRTMEHTHLISFLIIFRGEFHSATMSFHVQSKSFINGLMNGKYKILMGNVELRINLKLNFKL